MINLCSVVFLFGVCSGSSFYSDQISNYVQLISLYSMANISTVDFIPIYDLSNSMNVTVDMMLFALNDFDEVAGSIELVGALDMSWTDEIAAANGGSFNTGVARRSFLVPYNKIWTPKLVLSNAVDGVSAVGDSAYMCRFYLDTFRVQWTPRVLIKAACSPDVTYYPFDRQSCSFTYLPWGYKSSEILLLHTAVEWNLGSYEANGEWSLIETKTETFLSSATSYLKLSLIIERKPLYFAFNIILPVLVLCSLNSMVFWLPAASGERVGFSVTCFLSFVVLLNMVFDILPRSSSPISYLCYYLVVMMVFSGLTTGFVIVEMNAFHRSEDDKVPSWLQTLVKIITFRWSCSCRHNEASDTESQNSSMTSKDSLNGDSVKNSERHKLTRKVSTTHPKLKNANELNGELKRGSVSHEVNIDQMEQRGNSTVKSRKSVRREVSLCQIEQHENTDVKTKTQEITWDMIGNLLDKLFFIAFLGGQTFFSVTFLLPLGFRAMGP